MNILLDYVFPITPIEPTAEASTAFLKQVCLVCLKKSPTVAGTITECTSNAEVAVVTDNTDAAQLFNAGMSKVFILPVDDLELDTFLDGVADFYTLLISSDFVAANITQTKASGVVTISSYANLVSGTDDVITVAGVAFTAQTGAAVLGEATFQAATDNATTAASLVAQINAHATTSALVVASALSAVVTITAVEYGYSGNDIGLTYTDNDTNVGAVISSVTANKIDGGAGLTYGDFDGVVGVWGTDDAVFLPAQAAMSNRCAFYATSGNKAKNMCYAFGKLLSNSLNWLNQQYVEMPVADDVSTLGDANSLFDDKVSFVISDDQYSERLALFCAGGKAITAPYIKKNFIVAAQSESLQYISANQPDYTVTQAVLLEDEIKKEVIDDFISRKWITAGTVDITLVNENFVASGALNISEPKALWKLAGELRQTL